jgi:hypothetical protein
VFIAVTIRAFMLLFLAAIGCGAEGPAVSGGTTDVGDATTGATASTTDTASEGPTSASSDASTSTGTSPETCNGSALLCERSYDAVVFPGTHNSFSATESGFAPIAANQTHPIPTQLADGIRVFLLDVYLEGEETVLCHGACGFGSTPHREVLQQIADFLAAQPTEVLTIIYEDHASAAEIEADFVAIGLVELTYVHDGGPWPTLSEMIAANTRLVVTAEQGAPPPPWYQHVWDLTWDTPYTFMSIDAFTCDPNRGDPSHPLFLVNHWVSTEANLPDAAAAPSANALDVLLDRIDACPRLPTFLAVDFYEQGDLFEAVQTLNGL